MLFSSACLSLTMYEAGSGKTVITCVVIPFEIRLCDRCSRIRSSVVIKHLLEKEDSRVAYIYCDYKDQAAQTASNLVACLVRQLTGRAKPLP